MTQQFNSHMLKRNTCHTDTKRPAQECPYNSLKLETTKIFINGRMEYSTARKKNELQLHGTIWMCLTDIMLDKGSHTQDVLYASAEIKFKQGKHSSWSWKSGKS